MAINPAELSESRFVRATATHIPTWSIAFENRTVGHPATGAHHVETIYKLIINGVAEEDDYGSMGAADVAAWELGLPGAALPRYRQASPAGEQGWRH